MGVLVNFSPRLLTERVTMLLFFIPIAAATPLPSGGNSSALAAANCDPDYGWINGPEGSNKCYMYLKDTAYSACFPDGGGGYPDYSCDPANPNCYIDCYDSYCCQDPYACGGEHTTLASTGLRLNSAASRTTDSW